jgi:phytoene synthase|tara:strand:+ start:299 stop:1135 length:837 start_codon:yes stop_codon:yes gene_type:complete
MKAIFDKVSNDCSEITTKSYSTSFSLGIKILDKSLHNPIYGIYGFVRFADEIVDSFHNYNKKELFKKYKSDTYLGIKNKISLNPIINSFQEVVNKFKIDHSLIELFLDSMEMDLEEQHYDENTYKKYILGSAEVVGLMCLTIFVKGDKNQYKKLKPYAMKLGSAFQKINFLRDVNDDFNELGRTYFPEVNMSNFNDTDKLKIENEIENEFTEGLKGITMLPNTSKGGVYLAYKYYYNLFKKIKRIPANKILEKRTRISNPRKFIILLSSMLSYHLKKI